MQRFPLPHNVNLPTAATQRNSSSGRYKDRKMLRLGLMAISTLCFSAEAQAACQTTNPEARSATFSRLYTPGAPKDSVAHRGLFASDNPSEQFPENSPWAVREAVCNYLELVEIDIRSTSDGKAIILHDTSPSRTTNVGWPVANYSSEYNSRIKELNNHTLRPAAPPLTPSKEIINISQEDFLRDFRYYTVFHKNGSTARILPVDSTTKTRTFLKEFLLWSKSDPILKNSGIFVLDIQSLVAFKAAYQAVVAAGSLDRVIFKVWSTAIPVKYTTTFGNGKKQYEMDLSQVGDFSKTRLVVSINPVATKRTADLQYVIAFDQFINGSDGSTPGIRWLPYSESDSDYWLGANAVLSQLRELNNLYPSGRPFIGFETFIDGQNPTDPVDIFLALRRADKFAHLGTYAKPWEKSWGVKRGADYKRSSCTESGDIRFRCSVFPVASYSQGTDVLTRIPPAVAQRRSDFGIGADLIVNDISR